VLLTTVLAAASLAGCGRDDDRLVIYSGRIRSVMTPLLEQFAADTGIQVTVRYDTPARLAERLDDEGADTEADDTEADVFISPSPGPVASLDAAGRFDPLPDDVLALASEADTAGDPDATVVGVSGRVRTLIYNTDLLEPEDLPASVFDLVDDEFAGQVALAPSTASFQDFVTVLAQQAGEDEAAAWLQGMADGGPPIFPDNTSMIEAVGRGEVLMGLVNSGDSLAIKVDDPEIPVENHFFTDGDPGSPLLAMTASIVAGSDRPAEAQRLVEYLLSSNAQQYLAEQSFDYPLAADATPDAQLPPLEEVAPARVDLAGLGEGDDGSGDGSSSAQLIDESGLGG
jgi:iron(III) transport system substrate-binding protein